MIKSDEKYEKNIIKAMKNIINSVSSSMIDYIAIADAKTLKPAKHLKGDILIALAVKIGKTRLIDNVQVHI